IPRLPWLPAEAVPRSSTTTGKDGRFRLDGFGRERQGWLSIQGQGPEVPTVSGITPPGLKSPKGDFRGPTFDLLVGPGKELVGTVKVRGTGQPAAGVRISCQQCSGRTDELGNFRIEGLRKYSDYLGFATGPGYFQTMFEAKDSPGREA